MWMIISGARFDGLGLGESAEIERNKAESSGGRRSQLLTQKMV